jgi:hypothetical protein
MKYDPTAVVECVPLRTLNIIVDLHATPYTVIEPNHHLRLGTGPRIHGELVAFLRDRAIPCFVHGPFFYDWHRSVQQNPLVGPHLMSVSLLWKAERFVQFVRPEDEVRYGGTLLNQFGPAQSKGLHRNLSMIERDEEELSRVLDSMLSSVHYEEGGTPGQHQTVRIGPK